MCSKDTLFQLCARKEQITCVLQRTHTATHPATQPTPPPPRISHARMLRGALLPGNEEEGGGEAGAAAREQRATCGSSESVSTLLHLSARSLHIHFMSQSPPPPPNTTLKSLPPSASTTPNTSELRFAKGKNIVMETHKP